MAMQPPLPMAPMPMGEAGPPPQGRTPLRAPPRDKEQWTPSGGSACFGKGVPLQWTPSAMQGPQGFGGPEAGPPFDGMGGPGPPPPEQAFVPIGVYGGFPGDMPPQDPQDGGIVIEGGFNPMGQPPPFPAPVGGCQGEQDGGFNPAGPGMIPGPGMEGAMMQLSPEGVPMELVLPPDVGMQDRWECCWEWVQTGWCPRGLTCRWEHPPLQPMQPMGYAIFDQQAG